MRDVVIKIVAEVDVTNEAIENEIYDNLTVAGFHSVSVENK